MVFFTALTDFIPPSSLLQVFQTPFIFDSGFKFAVVLASSHSENFFPHKFIIQFIILVCSLELHSTENLMGICLCYFHWKVEATQLGDLQKLERVPEVTFYIKNL